MIAYKPPCDRKVPIRASDNGGFATFGASCFSLAVRGPNMFLEEIISTEGFVLVHLSALPCSIGTDPARSRINVLVPRTVEMLLYKV